MNKRNFMKIVNEYGWNIEKFDIDFRVQDSILNYERDMMLVLTKENRSIYLMVGGDIRVYGKHQNNMFIFKGKDSIYGELTRYLRKTGDWHNNNWFTVYTEKTWNLDGEVSYYLNDAIDDVIQCMEN